MTGVRAPGGSDGARPGRDPGGDSATGRCRAQWWRHPDRPGGAAGATFAGGPVSGQYVGAGPINGQQVPFRHQRVRGFSALVPVRGTADDYWALADDGYGSE